MPAVELPNFLPIEDEIEVFLEDLFEVVDELTTPGVVIGELDTLIDEVVAQGDVFTGLSESLLLSPIPDGSGPDIFLGSRQAETFKGFGGPDILLGGRRGDDLSGGIGTDIIFGHGGRDILRGGNQSDILAGGGGRDILIGGRGNDFLYGGDRGDIFRFFPNAGTDVVQDYGAGDRVQLLGFSDAELDSLSANAGELSNGKDGLVVEVGSIRIEFEGITSINEINFI